MRLKETGVGMGCWSVMEGREAWPPTSVAAEQDLQAGRYQQAHFPLVGTMKEGTVSQDCQET